MIIKLLKMHLENFKCWKDKVIEFGDNTTIYLNNYKGKSSIADGFYWVLFGKSSTGRSEGKEFRPRPYDKDGIDIDHIDVSVKLVLEIDGVEVSLKKTQRQNWVRKRGTQTEVHESDTNIYSWNNVEILKKEFDRRISDIVLEDSFKLITNPNEFFSRSKDEKRDILMTLVNGLTEEQILSNVNGFENLKDIVNSGKTIKDIYNGNKKSISDMEDEKERIESAIDERSRDIVEIDISELEIKKSDIQKQIEDIEAQEADTVKAYEEYEKAGDDILNLKMEIGEIKRKANVKLQAERLELQNEADDIQTAYSKEIIKKKELEDAINTLEQNVIDYEKKRTALGEEYKATLNLAFDDSRWVFDKDSTICPQCGREYEADKVDKILDEFKVRKNVAIERFDKDKKKRLEEITDSGMNLKKNIEDSNTKIEELKKQLTEIDLKSQENIITHFKEELAKLPSEADLSENQEYESLQAELTKKEEFRASMDSGEAIRSQLKAQKTELNGQLEEVKAELTKIKNIDEAKERVDKLHHDLKNKIQEISNLEKIQYQCEDFWRIKDDYLTEQINSKFKNVKFKLFREQKNKGTERVCDVYVKSGSPYGDNTTSGAEKIIAGLEIIKVISEIIGIKAPIFLDNAEAIDTDNVPIMDTQLIQLRVSKDLEMKIVEGK
jgi:DNA repair exonuclease SbcCD ATPase subunit